jgi:myo-inositol-1(or 4)-monophosphatase
MLASGLVDAVIEAGLQPWDVQALVPIIEGAGGIITAWNGDDVQNGGTVLACGDARLHAQLLRELRNSLP